MKQTVQPTMGSTFELVVRTEVISNERGHTTLPSASPGALWNASEPVDEGVARLVRQIEATHSELKSVEADLALAAGKLEGVWSQGSVRFRRDVVAQLEKVLPTLPSYVQADLAPHMAELEALERRRGGLTTVAEKRAWLSEYRAATDRLMTAADGAGVRYEVLAAVEKVMGSAGAQGSLTSLLSTWSELFTQLLNLEQNLAFIRPRTPEEKEREAEEKRQAAILAERIAAEDRQEKILEEVIAAQRRQDEILLQHVQSQQRTEGVLREYIQAMQHRVQTLSTQVGSVKRANKIRTGNSTTLQRLVRVRVDRTYSARRGDKGSVELLNYAERLLLLREAALKVDAVTAHSLGLAQARP